MSKYLIPTARQTLKKRSVSIPTDDEPAQRQTPLPDSEKIMEIEYLPANFNEKNKYAAIFTAPLSSSCTGKIFGIYAAKLTGQGFVCFVVDNIRKKLYGHSNFNLSINCDYRLPDFFIDSCYPAEKPASTSNLKYTVQITAKNQ